MIRIQNEHEISLQAWQKLMSELGLAEKLAGARRIAIKPNLAAGAKADPKRHICSEMALLKNVAELCRASNPNAEILICEGDSTGDGFAYLKFEHFDLPHAVDPDGTLNVGVLDLSRDHLTRMTDRRFKYFDKHSEKLWLSTTLVEADFKISLANLKTHSVTLYTGACKNLFGCLPASVKSVYHPYIHQVVHDLTLALKPDLSIVDAFYGMEKNGPVGGKDINKSFRIFGTDALEADCCGATVAGLRPGAVKYLRLLSKSQGMPVIDEAQFKPYQFVIQHPGKCLRVNNAIGLWIQRRGKGITELGHRLHTSRDPVKAVIAIFRPLLKGMIAIAKKKK